MLGHQKSNLPNYGGVKGEVRRKWPGVPGYKCPKARKMVWNFET